MKKLFLILILLAFGYSNSFSQIHIGLAGGMNFSDARQSELFFSRTNMISKPVLSGVFELDFGEHLHLKAEPQYIEKGTRSDEVQIEHMNAKVSMNLSYLEIPLYLKYSVGEKMRPYMFAGPVFGINLNSSAAGAFSGFEVSTDIDEVIHPVELGVSAGAGISYQIDEYVTIFLETKYSFGISDVIKKGRFDLGFGGENFSGEIPGGTKYFNRGMQVMFGFTFPLILK